MATGKDQAEAVVFQMLLIQMRWVGRLLPEMIFQLV
jgi:hypothetical protein